jgi:hypothetical protein
MFQKLNRFLDRASDFIAARKGLLPLIGVLLIVVNGILQFIPGAGWWAHTNIFLHVGILLAIFGILLAWAL